MANNNNNIVYGGDLMLFISSGCTGTSGVTTPYALAFSTSADLTINLGTRNQSSKDSGFYNEYAPTKFDWNVSTDGLYGYYSTASGNTRSMNCLMKIFNARCPVNIAYGIKTGSAPSFTVGATDKFTGVAIITSLKLNAKDGDNATYSLTAQGSGALSFA